jgi:hypothetical protein
VVIAASPVNGRLDRCAAVPVALREAGLSRDVRGERFRE